MLVLTVALMVGTAAGFTGSDRSALRGQPNHEALFLQSHHGSEIVAPSDRSEDRSTRGLQRLILPFALLLLLVASSQRTRRVLTRRFRKGWRVPVPLRRRGPPLLPVAA